MARTPPRKPSEPLASIVFRGGGRGTHMVVEALPELKDDLELAIVTKFIGAMRAHGTDMDPPRRGDRWPDFETFGGGHKIGIEVVEVINPDHAQKRAKQLQYLEELLPLVQDLAPALDQMAITIVDGYQDPPWPSARSTEGQRLIQHIARKLRAEADALARMAPEVSLHRQWDDFEDSSLRLGIMVLWGRPIPGSLTTGLDLRFAGTFPDDSAKMAKLLASTVDKKIEKAYAAYEGGQLWLLAYAQFPFLIDDGAVSLGRATLGLRSHPFDAVWAFFPYSGEQTGMIARVFP